MRVNTRFSNSSDKVFYVYKYTNEGDKMVGTISARDESEAEKLAKKNYGSSSKLTIISQDEMDDLIKFRKSNSRFSNSTNADKLSSYLKDLKVKAKNPKFLDNRDLASEIKGVILSKVFSKEVDFFDVTPNFFKIKSPEIVGNFKNLKAIMSRLATKGINTQDYEDIDSICDICYGYVAGNFNPDLYNLIGLKVQVFGEFYTDDKSDLTEDDTEVGEVDGIYYMEGDVPNMELTIKSVEKYTTKDYVNEFTFKGKDTGEDRSGILITYEESGDDELLQSYVFTDKLDEFINGNAVPAISQPDYAGSLTEVIKLIK